MVRLKCREKSAMKKVISILCTLVLAIGLAGCGKDTEDVLHLGLNAEIVEIDTAKQIIYVTDTSKEGVFGEKCGINCYELIVPNNMIYVDYDTSEVSDIKFSDLQIGDAVIVNAYESQLKGVSDGIINVEQIQLATQRLGND